MLMNARFNILRRLNLKGLIAGSMIMDYGKVADQMTPEDYVREVVAGKRFDNNLTKQMKKGFRVLNVIPNYVFDPRTLNYAAAILWENPDYDPNLGPQPTGILHRKPRIIPGHFSGQPQRGIGVLRPAGATAY
jgi:hypothetical protein